MISSLSISKSKLLLAEQELLLLWCTSCAGNKFQSADVETRQFQQQFKLASELLAWQGFHNVKMSAPLHVLLVPGQSGLRIHAAPSPTTTHLGIIHIDDTRAAAHWRQLSIVARQPCPVFYHSPHTLVFSHLEATSHDKLGAIRAIIKCTSIH